MTDNAEQAFESLADSLLEALEEAIGAHATPSCRAAS